MRMWMTDPRIMCRQHLLGEHVEHHMFVGTIQRGKSLDGYIADNLMEPASLSRRHAELVEEMQRRGMRHKSPLPHVPRHACTQLTDAQWNHRIDRAASHAELMRRCPACRERQSFWIDI